MKLQAFEITDLSLVRIAGAEAIKVLNGLCTAKLMELKAGGATEAMFTDDRGRVLAHGMIGLQPDGAAAWFVGQAFDAAKIAAHIDRFIFREQAEPRDVSRQWTGWLFDIDSAPDAWSKLAEKLSAPADADCAALDIQGLPGWMFRLPVAGSQTRLLLVPPGENSGLPGWLEREHVALGAPAELEDRRIRNFWPLGTREMNERTLPQELDRDLLAISFTKGCYLGQETVARLDAMGEVQRKLCLVELHGCSEVLTAESLAENQTGRSLLRDGKEVGKLNSISPIQHGDKLYALATMRRGSMAVGSQFAIANSDNSELAGSKGVVIAHP